MADHYLMTDALAATLTPGGDASAGNYATRFYIFGETGWKVKGVRFFLPVGTPTPATGGYAVQIWQQGNTSAPLVGKAFSGQPAINTWNEVLFDTPVDLTPSTYYMATLFTPQGGYGAAAHTFANPFTSSTTDKLYAAQEGEGGMGNGVYGYLGSVSYPGNPGTSWYGVDVLVTDGTGGGGGGARTPESNIALDDSVSYVRGGLASSVTFTGTATDSLGASTSASAVANTGAGGITTLRKGFSEGRMTWGSAPDPSVTGPAFQIDQPTECGVSFTLDWPARLTKFRIYKAPGLTGQIPITVWGTGSTVRYTLTVDWVVDAGGWREFTLPVPLEMEAGIEHRISYFAVNGKYAWSPWVYNDQPYVEPPFRVMNYIEPATGKSGGSVFASPLHGQPDRRIPHNFYVEPEVEWETNMPVPYDSLKDYYDQWENGWDGTKFPLMVFYSDPPWMKDYTTIGINSFMGIPIGNPGYRDAMLDAGVPVWADIAYGPDSAEQAVTDPALGPLICGYHLVDEPDMTHNIHTPQQIRDIADAARKLDSTRPLYLGLGKPASRNQGYTWATNDMIENSRRHRLEARTADVVGADDYNAVATENGKYGIWTYFGIPKRLKQIADWQKPVYLVVETCDAGINLTREPTGQEIHDMSWAAIIGGATGLIFFDHRFATPFFTQDFAAALHDPADRRPKWKALNEEITALSEALLGPAQQYVESVDSSNKNDVGPIGGTYGVPIEHISRTQKGKRYVFAQAARPGTTTATFKIPSAAGKSITVLGEFRAIAVDAEGVFTDNFTANYQVHKYEWTA